MDKLIMMRNRSRGLFLVTKEDYLHRIEHLARMINDNYPEISDTIDATEISTLYKSGSLHELVNYHDKIYQKIKEFNKLAFDPSGMLRSRLYS